MHLKYVQIYAAVDTPSAVTPSVKSLSKGHLYAQWENKQASCCISSVMLRKTGSKDSDLSDLNQMIILIKPGDHLANRSHKARCQRCIMINGKYTGTLYKKALTEGTQWENEKKETPE